MQVSSMVPGPPVHPGRGAGRPAAAAPPPDAAAAGAASAPAQAPVAPGADAKIARLEHALAQGNGQKLGIHKQLAAAEAAQQYQNDLRLTPPAAEAGEEVTVPPPVDTAPDPVVEAPAADVDAGDIPVVEAPADEVPVDEAPAADAGDAPVDEAPAADADAGDAPVDEAPAADADTPGETPIAAAPEPLEPIEMDLPSVTADLLDALEQTTTTAAPNESE